MSVNGLRILTSHFDNLYVVEPTEETIGLSGYPSLWVLNIPYM